MRGSKKLWWILLFGLLLRLPLLPFYGFKQDFLFYSTWANYLIDHSIARIYDNPDIFAYQLVNYPPVFLYLLIIPARIYHWIFSGSLETRVFLGFVKGIAIAFEIGTTLLLYRHILNRFDEEKAARVAGFYFLNPAILYVSVYYGQVDSIFGFFLLGAFLFLLDERYFLSGCWVAAALMMKIQALPFLPCFFFMILAKKQLHNFLKCIGGFLSVSFLILLPFIPAGQLRMVWERCVVENIAWGKYLTVGAFNLWYLHAQPTTLDERMWGVCFHSDGTCNANVWMQLLTYKNLGALLLGSVFLWILYRGWRQNRETNLWVAMAHLSLAFYLLPTKVHERYLYPFFIFYAPAAASGIGGFFLFWTFTTTYMINLLAICPLVGEVLDVSKIDSLWGVGAAAANVILYVLFLTYEYGFSLGKPGSFKRLIKAAAYSALAVVGLMFLRYEARLPNPAILYLSKIEPLSYQQTWPERKNPKTWDVIGQDLSTDGRHLRIGNRLYQYGLGAHAPSQIEYEIPGTYTMFEAIIGVDAEVVSAFRERLRAATITFEVWVNGEKRWESPLTLPTTPARSIMVPLPKSPNSNRLMLIVRDGGDGNYSDHADWALARVVKTYSP